MVAVSESIMKLMQVESYLETIVKPLLTKPEAFKVTTGKDDMGILLTFGVGKEDMGRIIGKAGATMNALRLLIRQFGSSHQARVSLKLEEPEGSTHQVKSPLQDIKESVA
jgi:predicted RNA-binding protein YlqC (UPF0109 family)